MIDQQFIISSTLWDGLSKEEVQATWEDLEKLELNQPPYKEFAVAVPAKSIVRLVGGEADQGELQTNFPLNQAHQIMGGDDTLFLQQSLKVTFPERRPFWLWGGRKETDIEFWASQHPADPAVIKLMRELAELAGWMEKALIVLLATKNVVKTTKESKLAKLGIGEPRPKYTTTLSLSRDIPNDHEHAATGRTLRPHLRRGHIRRQHYGPGRELIKQVFIQPCFVNADETFMNTRTAYNVIR